MKVQYALEGIEFRGGRYESLPANGVTVIVGPNSSGKSALLRELHNHLRSGTPGDSEQRWIAATARAAESSIPHLSEWFHSLAKPDPHTREVKLWDDQGYHPNSGPTNWTGIQAAWPNVPYIADRYLTRFFSASDRAQLLQSSQRPEPGTIPRDPIQAMWQDRSLERRFSRLVEQAFGFPVCLNRHSSSSNFLIGAPAADDERVVWDDAVVERYRNMRALSDEGDGVRAFSGLLLQAMAQEISAFFVDEPETFLHPPQARLLGRLLVDETGEGTQVVIATHSADILQGILDARSGREVKIIRLDITTDSENRHSRTFRTVDPQKLREFWSDPLLRYSGIIDGLFHAGVVVCESESDCLFYAAAFDSISAGDRAHDLKFLHVNGKERVGRAMEVLQRLGVRVAGIVDLDALNRPGRIGEFLTNASISRSLSSELTVISEFARAGGGGATVADLRSVVRPILDRPMNSAIDDDEAKQIKASVSLKSGWKAIKRGGFRAFEGDAEDAVQDVARVLREAGVHLVPVGELERWHPFGKLHGPQWAARALAERVHERPSGELSEFLRGVANGLGVRSLG